MQKYVRESRGTRNQELLCWRGPDRERLVLPRTYFYGVLVIFVNHNVGI
jgi:hypothetical protein